MTYAKKAYPVVTGITLEVKPKAISKKLRCSGHRPSPRTCLMPKTADTMVSPPNHDMLVVRTTKATVRVGYEAAIAGVGRGQMGLVSSG